MTMGDLSLPVRGAWIEICGVLLFASHPRSLPVRGAWIEMSRLASAANQASVAPCEGSVD